MKKINYLKLANSIRVGSGEYIFMNPDDFEMSLEGNIITVECKRTKSKVSTSLFNTIWFKLDEVEVTKVVDFEPKAEEVKSGPKSPKATKRTSKKDSK